MSIKDLVKQALDEYRLASKFETDGITYLKYFDVIAVIERLWVKHSEESGDRLLLENIGLPDETEPLTGCATMTYEELRKQLEEIKRQEDIIDELWKPIHDRANLWIIRNFSELKVDLNSRDEIVIDYEYNFRGCNDSDRLLIPLDIFIRCESAEDIYEYRQSLREKQAKKEEKERKKTEAQERELLSRLKKKYEL